MRRRLILAFAASLIAAPATAQEALPSPEEVRDANGFTIGLGAAIHPDYEGSDDYRLIPGGAIRGKVGGISFQTRGLYLYVDAVNTGGKVDFDAGPIVGVRLNRTGKVEDNAVDELPDRNMAFEVGGFAGVSFSGLTNPYDTLSVRLDVVKDMASAHESTVFAPNLEFSTPLSRTLFVGASLSSEFVGDRYADYYYSITPAGALASGLDTYDADGGMKSWTAGLLANHSLSGDLRRGWSLFGLVNYTRLVGDFADSPIVDDRGSASQWFAGAGAGYSF